MLKKKNQTITEIIFNNKICTKINFKINLKLIFNVWWKYLIVFLIAYIVSALNTFYLYIIFEDGFENLEIFGTTASSLFSLSFVIVFITIEFCNKNYNTYLKNNIGVYFNKFLINYLLILFGTVIFIIFIYIIGKNIANYDFEKDFILYALIHSIMYLTAIYWIFVALAFYIQIRIGNLKWFYIIAYTILLFSILLRILQILLNKEINFFIQNILMYIPFLNITFMDYSKIEILLISNFWTYLLNFGYGLIFITIDTILVKKINLTKSTQ